MFIIFVSFDCDMILRQEDYVATSFDLLITMDFGPKESSASHRMQSKQNTLRWITIYRGAWKTGCVETDM